MAERTKVLVLGGGIGGLTAAHELCERGFEVSAVELKTIPGGKARTIPKPDSGTDGRPDLPGEHGFRFVPAFYRHLPDSMKRIPFGSNPQGCYDNLTPTSRIELAPYDKAPILLPSRFPRSLSDLILILKDAFDPPKLGLNPGELEYFAERLWQVMTSCRERRMHELENQSWSEFTGADTRSAAYRTYLVNGLSRSLVAAQAEFGSARTIGQVQVHLIFGVADPFTPSTDNVLNGPTSPQLLEPWIAHVRELGGTYRTGIRVTDFACEHGLIRSVGMENVDTKETWRESADFYVAALPVEVMGPLLSEAMLGADPSLANLREIETQVRWMNGLQFFLKRDVTIAHGHCLYVDSPWAITSISQAQFWNSIQLPETGDGQVHGILSVDISDWTTEGNFVKKKAQDCNEKEIVEEVWKELERSLNVDGKKVIDWDDVHSWFLDTDIVIPHPMRPSRDFNLEPLFINTKGTWEKRPQAGTGIENLFFAADYVQTNADLACMDAANEAGRRAVNAILDRSGSNAARCRIWNMDMPAMLLPMRVIDQVRWSRGEPWSPSPLDMRRPEAGWATLKAAIASRARDRDATGAPYHPAPADEGRITTRDDAYHLAEYEGAEHLFWYVEWWYFNFTDPTTGRAGMVTFAVFNGADVDLLGVCSLNCAVFDPEGTGTTMEMDYHDISKFWASEERANVDLAGSTIRVRDDGRYEINAASADGTVAMELVYTAADEPQFLANNVHSSKQWEVSSWIAWMPSATVQGWVTVHGTRYEFSRATGYHDHDWGIWFVPGSTWAWAAFSDPEKRISFDVGLHAAFQKSTAYFRRGDTRLTLPQEGFESTFHDWESWKVLWKYPRRVTFSAPDSTGQWRVELEWKVKGTATLWKYPLLVFEQTAHFVGRLMQKGDDGTWKEVETFDLDGFCEYTSEWVGGGPS